MSRPCDLFVCVLLLAGCGSGPFGTDDTSGGGDDHPSPTDADEDGFPAGDDCDDHDASVNPDASEVCDPANEDENCNGVADDADAYATGQSTWYRDADGDGFGTPLDTQLFCDQPGGYIADGTDCDDGDPATNPEREEVCDAVDKDENCNGLVNDADPGMAEDGLSVWYRDADHDGFGDPSATVEACDAPTGYVAEANDCDDTDAAVTPEATEICDDGVDNDCDGTPNACGILGTIALSRGTAEAKIAGLGSNDALTYMHGMAPAGDLDSDGFDDFVLGALNADGSAATGSGEAYVFFGPVSGFSSVSAADTILAGGAASDAFGCAVLGGFDASGDGREDLVVGALAKGSTDTGGAYLYRGPLSVAETASSADTTWTGAGGNDYLGGALAAGDFNDDGRDDLVIGSYDGPYLFHGTISIGTISMSSANAFFSESMAFDSPLASGDADGDGLFDLAIGDYDDDMSDSGAGTVYFVSGEPSGTVTLDTGADAWFVGEDGSDAAGKSLALRGDANDDGYDDLAIGAPEEDAGGSGSGAVYILFGPLDGYLDLSASDVKLWGESDDDACGSSVAWAGDVNGDGRDDLLVGCASEDTASSGAGAAYLLYGPVVVSGSLATADAKLLGESSDDATGYTVAGAGDVNGDGTADILIGAHGDDDGGSDAGAALLLLGGGM
jgi:hypothetical protein